MTFNEEEILKKINLECEYLYDYIIREGYSCNTNSEIMCNHDYAFGRFVEDCEGCPLFEEVEQ